MSLVADEPGRADEQTLRAWYDDHAGPLRAFALRLTGGDRGRCEDIVQETLTRAWQHRDALAADAAGVRPWLFTVARRIAVDAHRRRSARPAEVSAATVGEIPLASPNDDADIERRLDAMTVRDAVTALSPAHRDVLAQTFYAGRSVAEAADTLGVPAGTVKSRTYYALKALRLALIERGVEL